MYPHGYGNPFPSEHPYQDQQSMMQEHQDLRHGHSHHPAQHYPPGFSSSPSFPHPSSFHHPPGLWSFDNNPPPDAPPNSEYFQYSFPPPPPSTHQSFYPPPPDAYPPHQYGFPHPPSFESHQHSSPAQDTRAATAAPTLGERILSSLENAFGHSSSGGEHSRPPSANTYARPASFDHSHSSSHSSSHHDNKPPHVHSAFEYSPGSSMSHHSSSNRESEPQIEEGSSDAPFDYTYSTTPPPDVELPKGQLVRVFCKSNRSYNLAVKDGRLTMVNADSENESQQWIRDDKYSIRVRDSCGHPAFMLINKASKMVLKHANDKWQEVQLTYYSPDIQDDDLFWTESQDFGEGFKTLRMASNTLRNLSVGRGKKFEDGSPIILDTWHKKDNQLWKVFPL